jgi:hypothetical protein
MLFGERNHAATCEIKCVVDIVEVACGVVEKHCTGIRKLPSAPDMQWDLLTSHRTLGASVPSVVTWELN